MNIADNKNSNEEKETPNLNLSAIKHSNSNANFIEEFKSISSNGNEDIVINFESMSQEEISSNMKMLKSLYERKLKEIDNVHHEIKQKDEMIDLFKSTQGIEKEITQMKKEINQLKRGHQKNLREVESKCKEAHGRQLEEIKQAYGDRIKQIAEENDKNIKVKQEIVNKLRSKLEHYERNQGLFLTSKAHQEIISKQRQTYEDEIADMEKELGLMDKLVIGKNVYGHLDTIRMSDSVDVTTNHNEMRNATYDLIGLINQLDTNANVVNQSELEETEVYDEVPINRINNLSMNKGLIEDKLRYYGV